MPITDSNFNVAKFLYYNPELSAFSNIVDNSAAYEYAFSNDVSGLVWDDRSIPVEFNSESFLLDYKKNLDSSRLNMVIGQAMMAEGFTERMLAQRSKYLATIYQDVLLENSNVFRFNFFPVASNDAFYVTSNVLGVGDYVKLMNNATKVFEYATVAEVLDPERVVLSNARKVYDGLGDTYKVIGIRLYDYVRLAKINYLRGLDPPPQVPAGSNITYIDPSFNPDLYRLLYPDAEHMSDLKAYHDYVARRDNNDLRIGRVQDIPLDSNEFTKDFDNLSVSYRLTIAENGALRWGSNYVYGISEDDVTEARLINPSMDRVPTEWAIKTYVDRPYLTTATFCNVTVNGTTLLTGPTFITGPLELNDLNVNGVARLRSNVFISSNLDVVGNVGIGGNLTVTGDAILMGGSNYIQNVRISNSEYENGALFKTDVYMESNLYVRGYNLGPRFGIGPAVPVDYTATPSGLYDAKLKNADVREVLDVGTALAPGTLAVRVNGFIEADNVSYVSDARLKNVERVVDGAKALSVLDEIEPIVFTYKHAPDVKKIGFVADKVEAAVPEAVTKIARYEVDVTGEARVGALGDELEFEGDGYGLDVGDEVFVCGGWIEVLESSVICERRVVKVVESNVLRAKSMDRVPIEKIRYKEVRSIDYPALVSVMWAAVKALATGSTGSTGIRAPPPS